MKYEIDHEFVSISSQTASHRIILIHGWGADADDLLSVGKHIKEISNVDFEVLSLRAPGLHPNNTGRQWYRLYPPDWDEAENQVNNLLLSIRKLGNYKIPLKKTILLVLTMIIYGATILKVGFFLSTSLFLVLSYYFLGERRWKYIIIFSFPFVAIFMYLLHGVLAVYLRDPLLKYIGIMG